MEKLDAVALGNLSAPGKKPPPLFAPKDAENPKEPASGGKPEIEGTIAQTAKLHEIIPEEGRAAYHEQAAKAPEASNSDKNELAALKAELIDVCGKPKSEPRITQPKTKTPHEKFEDFEGSIRLDLREGE